MPVPDFRYPQFCALARAAEILCERWNLLILRDLMFGPKRFSDLRRGLSEISPSVLTERLGSLERYGVVERASLEPPAASVVYRLGPAGEALLPAIRELGRWGARFLVPAMEGERVSAQMLPFYLRLLAADDAVPGVSVDLHALGEDDVTTAVSFHVRGGPRGTEVREGAAGAATELTGTPLEILSLACGYQAPSQSRVRVAGDPAGLAALPKLFRSYFPPLHGTTNDPLQHNKQGDRKP